MSTPQVDAFTAQPFKGNPAADDAAAPAGDGRWMQSVAVEFNLSQTAFFSRDSSCAADAATPRFHLRWFTPVTEVALCGHATLATAHFLFTSVLAERHGVVEFATKSGVLTAKKVPAPEAEEQGKLFIELDFPMSDYVGCEPADELPSIPETLNGAPVVSVHKSVTTNDLIGVQTVLPIELGLFFFVHAHSRTRPGGSLERYKARWVVHGFRQRAGVDFIDTFAPLVKPSTIRAMLRLAVSRACPVHQLDLSNAFLHGHLAEQVYCEKPTGFVDAAHPDFVCLLSRSLYGLK
ncbi:Retrovirus-related Pol polyprotein from transposon TNT 1-94 [Triticum urartu]|uniref:Retrovirus-related Pol polyprotein from transposon TNT 1-94 n=1 Tax=Triticum urartu TaxID=4572 RepID=M8A570_TRIUA|nr:Retrovirus-related Pol polyprotein from transposon TNT 1-94 [Triticum urartu]